MTRTPLPGAAARPGLPRALRAGSAGRAPGAWGEGRARILAIPALALLALAPAAALAQEVTLDLGGEGSLTLRAVQLFVIVTLLSLAPALAVTVTCFPFMVTVLSILRSAIGLQQSPPNMLIVSLALFLSWFVMAPVFDAAWRDGVRPMLDDELRIEEAAPRILAPFRTFMASRVDPDAMDALVSALPRPGETPGSAPQAPPSGPLDEEAPPPEAAEPLAPAEQDGAPPTDLVQAETSVLVPAFLLSEIQRAFEIGFLVYLPFLLIDLVVASVLMSMGMMMVPPAVVSLPFKLAFFVAADGWSLLAGALVRGYAA